MMTRITGPSHPSPNTTQMICYISCMYVTRLYFKMDYSLFFLQNAKVSFFTESTI